MRKSNDGAPWPENHAKILYENYRRLMDERSLIAFVKSQMAPLEDPARQARTISYTSTLDGKACTQYLARAETDDHLDPSLVLYPLHLGPDLTAKGFREGHVPMLCRQLAVEPAALYLETLSCQERETEFARDVGAQVNAYSLLGDVSISLEKARERARAASRPNLEIRALSGKEDIDEVLELERICHTQDASSRFDPRRERAMVSMRRFYESWVAKGNAFGLREHGRWIGVYALNFRPGESPVAFICTVSIHPERQGHGLSYLLYHHALTRCQKARYRYFMGASTTKRVLGAAKRLSREIVSTYWRLELSEKIFDTISSDEKKV